MKPRPITTFYEGSRVVARVQLGRDPNLHAEIYKEDFDFLVRLGLSPNWTRYTSKNFYVTAAARNTPSHRVLVARVLLDAGEGHVVRYADGNPMNLRRENLRLVASAKGKSRARSFVYAKNFVEVSP